MDQYYFLPSNSPTENIDKFYYFYFKILIILYMYDQKMSLYGETKKSLLEGKFQVLFKGLTATIIIYFSCLINEKLLRQFNLSRDVNASFYFSSLITEELLKHFNMFRDAKQICQHSFCIYVCSS